MGLHLRQKHEDPMGSPCDVPVLFFGSMRSQAADVLLDSV